MKITINGGHCPGLDSGAVGATGLQEAVVIKDVMQRVAGGGLSKEYWFRRVRSTEE